MRCEDESRPRGRRHIDKTRDDAIPTWAARGREGHWDAVSAPSLVGRSKHQIPPPASFEEHEAVIGLGFLVGVGRRTAGLLEWPRRRSPLRFPKQPYTSGPTRMQNDRDVKEGHATFCSAPGCIQEVAPFMQGPWRSGSGVVRNFRAAVAPPPTASLA